MDESTDNRSRIQIGDFVWAKMKGFPPWPSRILRPGPNVPAKPVSKDPSKEVHWVYFFGSHNYAWMEEVHIKPYNLYKDKYIAMYKTSQFKDAVKETDDILLKLKENPEYEVKYVDYVSEPKRPPAKKRTPKVKRAAKEIINTVPKKRSRRSLSDGSSEGSSDTETSTTESSFLDSPSVKRTKEITASRKTFGFLGIGIIGSAICKNLIASGHKVNIWNRSPWKCAEVLSYPTMGVGSVTQYDSPREVLQNSDITFSCLSDPEASKSTIQQYFGIDDLSDNMLEGKGFVEITGIDPESSLDICEMIENKGGRYLEAQIQGSKLEAQEGSLIVLTAGDNNLFMECQSCFKAMGKTSFFLGAVGYAAKINLIIQLMKAICLVGLSEGLALADRCGISTEEFLNVFNLTSLANPYLSGKANIIIHKKFLQVEQAVQYLQKDVKLGLDMSNKLKQPMVMASTANEIFKHARRLGYDGHDASCVYMRTRH